MFLILNTVMVTTALRCLFWTLGQSKVLCSGTMITTLTSCSIVQVYSSCSQHVTCSNVHHLLSTSSQVFCCFIVTVSDVGPGEAAKLGNLLAKLGVSIKGILHGRAFLWDERRMRRQVQLAAGPSLQSNGTNGKMWTNVHDSRNRFKIWPRDHYVSRFPSRHQLHCLWAMSSIIIMHSEHIVWIEPGAGMLVVVVIR